MTVKLWISTDGNGGYDIGQGDVTIASVLATSDIPRPMIPFDQEHDPRALALLFKAAPDLLAVAVSVSTMRGQDGEPSPLARDALAAIAKAKGGAA